jgi:chromosomal replication initiator protein
MAHDSTSKERELLAVFRQRLAERIGQDRFRVWFAPPVEFRHRPGVVSIVAGDRFSTERLRRSFRDDALAICEAHLGEVRQIEFLVDERIRNELKELTPGGADKTPMAKHEPSPPRIMAPTETVRGGRRFRRLEEFVVGDENRVAHSAASAAAGRLGAVSPLFFHGPTGSGKTHLLEGVWSAVRRAQPGARCVYLSAEQFTTYFLEALQGSGLPSFRRKYREVQLLLIDDVQFFTGKRATLVELLHTIDTLQRSGGQLALSADRPPMELTGLGPELAARMSAGLVCGVAPADAATRRAILERLAQQRRLAVPPDVLEELAKRLPGDGRRLQGAINRLEAAAEAQGANADWSLACRALSDLFQTAQRPVELRDIERAVCDVFGVDSPTLHSPRKAKGVAQPRMLAMWLARKHTRSALQDICHYFGRRSHSTVISAERKITRWMEGGAAIQLPQGACDIREAVRRVESRLNAG